MIANPIKNDNDYEMLCDIRNRFDSTGFKIIKLLLFCNPNSVKGLLGDFLHDEVDNITPDNIDEYYEELCTRIAKIEADRKAQEQKEKRRQQRLKTRKKRICALLAVVVIASSIFGVYFNKNYLIPQKNYDNALAMMGMEDFEGAKEIFENLASYKDSQELALSCEYGIANKLFSQGEYEEALTYYESLGIDYKDCENQIKDCKYEMAKALAEKGEAKAAIDILKEIVPYKDGDKLISACTQDLAKGFSNHTVACTQNATYALTIDGKVLATGDTDNGMINVGQWEDIIAIAAGRDFAIGLKRDGTIVSTKRIAALESWDSIVDISASDTYVAAVKSDGTVLTAGLGINEGEKEDTSLFQDIIQVSQGYDGIVGLKADGTVIASGNNYYGQLNIDNWKNIIQIETDYSVTAGLRSDGTVVCVGYQEDWQCNVDEWTDIVQIGVQDHGIIGLKSDGTLVSTGAALNSKLDYQIADDYSEETGLSVKDIDGISSFSTDINTILVRRDGRVVVIGPYSAKNQQKVDEWENVVTGLRFSDEVLNIQRQEVIPFEVNNIKSEAEKDAEEWAKKEEARINKSAPIYIGMNAEDALNVLNEQLGSSNITKDEEDFTAIMTNAQAAKLFDFGAINRMPKISKASFVVSNKGDNSLLYIYLYIDNPGFTTDGTTESCKEGFNAFAKSIGCKDSVRISIMHPDHGNYKIYSGSFTVDGVGVYMTKRSNQESVAVGIYR